MLVKGLVIPFKYIIYIVNKQLQTIAEYISQICIYTNQIQRLWVQS